MSAPRVPLSSLAPGSTYVVEPVGVAPGTTISVNKTGCINSFGPVFTWFIIVAIIVWLLLIAFKPTAVQVKDLAGNPTGQVNQGSALGAAIIAGIIVAFLVWLFKRCA